MKAFLAAGLFFLAAPLAAQEYVQTDRPLSDEDFYHLVACAAPPDGDCAKPMLFWPETRRAELRVGFASKAEALQPWQDTLYAEALAHAVDEINRVGGGIRLTTADAPHDIAIHIRGTPPNAVITDNGLPKVDGRVLPLAQVMVRARGRWIQNAVISVSVHTPREAIASVMLEEIVQALGLLTDIHSPVYRRSIFAEDSNAGIRLRGQDAMVIRRHYPPT